jgi:hypothetical protein
LHGLAVNAAEGDGLDAVDLVEMGGEDGASRAAKTVRKNENLKI